jgi:hypothetical protein
MTEFEFANPHCRLYAEAETFHFDPMVSQMLCSTALAYTSPRVVDFTGN